MLRDITIENYRLFREFSLDSLARVNLIVGPNSSGKSSLLEAVYLLTSEGARSSLLHILDERGELVPGSVDYRLERGQTGGYQIAHIFYGHQLMTKESSRIRSELDIAQSLTLSLAGADILSQPSLFEETALREGISRPLAQAFVQWLNRLFAPNS
jgi:predicted ATPase